MVQKLLITDFRGINKNRGNKNHKVARIFSTLRVLIVTDILESLFSNRICRGGAAKHVSYSKCQRKYFKGNAAEITNLHIFCGTWMQW